MEVLVFVLEVLNCNMYRQPPLICLARHWYQASQFAREVRHCRGRGYREKWRWGAEALSARPRGQTATGEACRCSSLVHAAARARHAAAAPVPYVAQGRENYIKTRPCSPVVWSLLLWQVARIIKLKLLTRAHLTCFTAACDFGIWCS